MEVKITDKLYSRHLGDTQERRIDFIFLKMLKNALSLKGNFYFIFGIGMIPFTARQEVGNVHCGSSSFMLFYLILCVFVMVFI